MWASRSKWSCSICFWAVQVSSLPLSWQIRGFPPWVTKAVLIHPRGTCTWRNCSRRNGRYGDGDIEGRYIAMLLRIPTHDSTVFTCAGRMRWIIWSDFQQNRSPPPPRSCSFRRATNRKETSKAQRCGSFPCLSQKVQRTKKVLLVRQAVTVHPGPSPIFAFEVLVLKHNDTHKNIQTSQPGETPSDFSQQSFRLKLLPISLKWRRNCSHTETAQSSLGHVHSWGEKWYSLKTCRSAQVTTAKPA